MKQVIIVDDDPGIQHVLGIILQRAGYEPTIYPTATDILDLNFKEPDVFIIDKQLPGADGLDVCRFLKNRQEFDTPIILFSASCRVQEQALEAGADHFLEKPFKIKSLLSAIEEVTEKAH